MVDARGGDVAHASAGGAQAALPVLLVAGAAEQLVERPDPLERAAPQRQVRAPDELGVAVLGAEVERGDRQRLASAGVQPRALEPRADRAAERVVLPRRREQRVEPAGPDLDVVVEEAEQFAPRGRDRRVAGDVDAARAPERDVARAVSLRQRRGGGVLGVVLDDHDLGAVRGGLRRDGRERDLEVREPRARREQDRGGRGHRGGEVRRIAAQRSWRTRLAVDLVEDREVVELAGEVAARGEHRVEVGEAEHARVRRVGSRRRRSGGCRWRAAGRSGRARCGRTPRSGRSCAGSGRRPRAARRARRRPRGARA